MNNIYVPRSSFDIWVEGRISRYDDDAADLSRDGRFRILYVGADYLVAPVFWSASLPKSTTPSRISTTA